MRAAALVKRACDGYNEAARAAALAEAEMDDPDTDRASEWWQRMAYTSHRADGRMAAYRDMAFMAAREAGVKLRFAEHEEDPPSRWSTEPLRYDMLVWDEGGMRRLMKREGAGDAPRKGGERDGRGS